MDILGNNVGEEQANNLIQLLDGSDTLQTLCGLTGTETKVDLSGRNLSASCAILVANELKVNSALICISFDGNGDNAKTVKLESSMVEVKLSGKGLGPGGALITAAFLPKMT